MVLLRAHQSRDIHQVYFTWKAPGLMGCALPPTWIRVLEAFVLQHRGDPGPKHSPAFLQLESPWQLLLSLLVSDRPLTRTEAPSRECVCAAGRRARAPEQDGCSPPGELGSDAGTTPQFTVAPDETRTPLPLRLGA